MVQRYANSMLVIPAWINSVTGLRSDICATQLADNSTWGASGFIVATVVGGAGPDDITAGRPVVELAVYAGESNRSRPLWATANNIYQTLVHAVWPHTQPTTIQRELTLSMRGKSYGSARVMSAYPLSEEKQRRNISGDYACVWANWQFHWIKAGE